jgi:hypothetical protein
MGPQIGDDLSMHGMNVLVVHNRYASAQPSGENKVVDQEVELLRAAGHRAEVFERRSATPWSGPACRPNGWR